MTNIDNIMEEIEISLGFKSQTSNMENYELSFLSKDWIKSIASNYKNFESEADKYHEDFNAKFNPYILRNLDFNNLAEELFIGKNKNNLCYELEFNNTSTKLFTGIGGGSSFKYPCFYNSQLNSWVTGSARKNTTISEAEANQIAKKTIDKLIIGYETITSYKDKLDNEEAYFELYSILTQKIGNLSDKGWVKKYYTILFPNIFSPFYNDEWLDKALKALTLDLPENNYVKNARITLFAHECDISTIILSRIIYDIIDGKFNDVKLISEEKKVMFNFTESRLKSGQNLIVYGTPGCGKSYYVEHTLLKDISQDRVVRTTFFQDYTNTDFVGQILPVIQKDENENDKVTYEFNPGPFTLALEKAIANPNDEVALVIEELNRGNAASIFGDIFQLLDRQKEDDLEKDKIKGISIYRIFNRNIIDYLNDKFKKCNYEFKYIKLPSNLSIFATMNTCDQNVFTLDSAFKRRWDYKKLQNKFKEDHKFKDLYIPGADITWKQLVEYINNFILTHSDGFNSEDKQIGVYFVDETGMTEEILDISEKQKPENRAKIEKFAYKVMEYLWDDVAKFQRDKWFSDNINSLDKLIEGYCDKGTKVFKEEVLKKNENE